MADAREVLSVADLTALIRGQMRAQFGAVWVVGEVSDIAQPASGHIYLTLKDSQAQLRAVIWQSTAKRLPCRLQDGMEVLCGGEMDIYPRHGTYQLVIKVLEPRGAGARQLALQQLRAKLTAEGLFDPQRKRPLPRFPRRVAVVTSPTSAAVRDFLEVARRRCRATPMLVIPSAVQGDQAVAELVHAIQLAHQLRPLPDVLVVTRGGGSLEDLEAFNDERLVRAIAAAEIPVVSAIGHEIDVTLCDLVADVRALTPSEAAERVLPDEAAWTQRLTQVQQSLHFALVARLQQARQRWRFCAEHPRFTRPLDRIHDEARRLDELTQAAQVSMQRLRQRGQERLAALAARLDALSPLAVLGRGFAVITRGDTPHVIRSIAEVNAGDSILARLPDGRFEAQVRQVLPVATTRRHEES